MPSAQYQREADSPKIPQGKVTEIADKIGKNPVSTIIEKTNLPRTLHPPNQQSSEKEIVLGIAAASHYSGSRRFKPIIDHSHEKKTEEVNQTTQNIAGSSSTTHNSASTLSDQGMTIDTHQPVFMPSKSPTSFGEQHSRKKQELSVKSGVENLKTNQIQSEKSSANKEIITTSKLAEKDSQHKVIESTNFGNMGLNSPRESNSSETVTKFGNRPVKIDISTFQKQSKLDNAESSSHPCLQIGEAINKHSPVTLETRDKESQTISSTVDNAGVDKSTKEGGETKNNPTSPILSVRDALAQCKMKYPQIFHVKNRVSTINRPAVERNDNDSIQNQSPTSKDGSESQQITPKSPQSSVQELVDECKAIFPHLFGETNKPESIYHSPLVDSAAKAGEQSKSPTKLDSETQQISPKPMENQGTKTKEIDPITVSKSTAIQPKESDKNIHKISSSRFHVPTRPALNAANWSPIREANQDRNEDSLAIDAGSPVQQEAQISPKPALKKDVEHEEIPPTLHPSHPSSASSIVQQVQRDDKFSLKSALKPYTVSETQNDGERRKRLKMKAEKIKNEIDAFRFKRKRKIFNILKHFQS